MATSRLAALPLHAARAARLAAPSLAAPSRAAIFSAVRAWAPARAQSSQAAAGEAGAPGTPEGDAAAAAAAAAAGSASPSSAPDPRDASLKALADEVTKLKTQVAELNSARLRGLAEMENVRAIAKRDVAQGKDYALQSFAKALLNVVDNLHRAVSSVPEDARAKREGHEVLGNLYEGVAATERDFLKILGQHGIEPFGAPGDKFDYNRHEAMLQLPPTPEAPSGTVAHVLKKGYSLKDRTLRVAQVAVSVDQPGGE
jgi:molecular chaperone GrpE